MSSVTVRAAPACSPMARQRRSATALSRPRRLAGYLRSRVRGTVAGAVNASARRAMAAMPGATPRIPRPGGARRGRRTAAGSESQRRRVSRRAHADRRVGQVRRRRSGPTSTRRSSKRHIELSHRPGRSSCAAARAAPAPGPSRPDRRRSQARCVVACLGETADGMSATRWCRSSSAPVSPARCVRVSVPIRGSRASSSSSISDLDGTSMTPDRRRHRRPSSRSGDNPLCKSPSYAGSAAPASPASAAASSLRELMSNLP